MAFHPPCEAAMPAAQSYRRWRSLCHSRSLPCYGVTSTTTCYQSSQFRLRALGIGESVRCPAKQMRFSFELCAGTTPRLHFESTVVAMCERRPIEKIKGL